MLLSRQGRCFKIIWLVFAFVMEFLKLLSARERSRKECFSLFFGTKGMEVLTVSQPRN